MKTLFNLTTSSCDLDRFADQGELLALLEGFDGVELMCFEPDSRGILPPGQVVGVHMNCLPAWYDLYVGDLAACEREFGSLERCEAYYGGLTRAALLERYRRDLESARRYGAEYLVFHVMDAGIEETMTLRFRHSDEEIIEGACALLNELFAGEEGLGALLLENLWEPGLRFTDPALTARLLEGVRYENTGLMLDTGHLMHTNTALRNQAEGLRYIHAMLDRHGELCRHIRGVHLNQSVTGDYMERVRRAPPAFPADYDERCALMFDYIFRVDLHQPFTAPGVRALLERIAPDYCTFEFISNDLPEHRELLRRQRAALEA